MMPGSQGLFTEVWIDYSEIFSPMIKFSIRALLAYAVENDIQIHQMFVVTAFLNGDLNENIYMDQPERYVVKGKEKFVNYESHCMDLKSHLDTGMPLSVSICIKLVSFRVLLIHVCAFIRHKPIAIVAVYVDDLIIVTKTTEEMISLKKCLADSF
uniref:Reverse transcriptase Ty1/copia-type domain-containing protein n=1 Tax=Amphimedon queenslandica TaxID=400682 RepID=A0A1X7U332_AMPQE